MARDMFDGNIVTVGRLANSLYQVEVGSGPAVSQDTDHIPAVGDDFDPLPAVKSLQSGNDGHQFHAVVSGVALPTADDLLLAAVLNDGGIASGAGVAFAGAIGEKCDRHEQILLLKTGPFSGCMGWINTKRAGSGI
jgi:hypothetical protein